jgi:hypothetical protein
VQNNKAYYNANKDVIDILKTQITDFKRYDNWYFSNGRFYFSERNGDTYFDMLIIVYRWAKFDWFQLRGGIAKLGFSTDIVTADGIKISGLATDPHGSGITSKIGKWTDAFNITIHFAHEYGHYLFGGYHTAMGGLMMGDPWDYNGTYAMNAWEREKLGYIPISNMYNGQPKTINDYVTTGDALRVRTNSVDPNEYFILENHQRANYFDQVIRGGALQGAMDPNATLGKGLYVWYFKNGSTYPPTVWSIQADGGFNWQFVEYRTLVGWGGPGQPDPIRPALDRGESYRNLPNNILNEVGRCDRNRLYYNSPTGWKEDYRWWDKDPLTGSWIISREPLGDETDAFKMGYNDQITPWSNPSSTKTSGLTNVSIKITNESNGSIELVYNNTYQGALDLPPSKPQNLQIGWNGVHPKLTWESNLEPDVINGGSYKIYRAIYENGNLGPYSLAGSTPHVSGSTQQWTDNAVYKSGKFDPVLTYYYQVSALDTQVKESVRSDFQTINGYGVNNKESADEEISEKELEYNLVNAYPNPFNPVTTIIYKIKEKGLVSLTVYDILGREAANLVNENQEEGSYTVNFDASNLPSGVYIYTLQVNDFISSKKMTVIK